MIFHQNCVCFLSNQFYTIFKYFNIDFCCFLDKKPYPFETVESRVKKHPIPSLNKSWCHRWNCKRAGFARGWKHYSKNMITLNPKSDCKQHNEAWNRFRSVLNVNCKKWDLNTSVANSESYECYRNLKSFNVSQNNILILSVSVIIPPTKHMEALSEQMLN